MFCVCLEKHLYKHCLFSSNKCLEDSFEYHLFLDLYIYNKIILFLRLFVNFAPYIITVRKKENYFVKFGFEAECTINRLMILRRLNAAQ